MQIGCISYTINLLSEKLHFIRLDVTRCNHVLEYLPNLLQTLLPIQLASKISQLLPLQTFHNKFHVTQNTIYLSRRRISSNRKIIHFLHRSLNNPLFLFNSIFNRFLALFAIFLCSFFSSGFIFFTFLFLFLSFIFLE